MILSDYKQKDAQIIVGWKRKIGRVAMIEYRFAAVSDIDALIQSRLEMLRVVNDLGDDYVFGEDFVQASRDYFLKGDQITVFALQDNIVVGCGSICFMELMPTFSHPSGKRAHLMNVYTNGAYRRQGIAYKMTTMLIEEAWDRGATEISLDATESGRPLYRKCGFKDSDECMVLVRKN